MPIVECRQRTLEGHKSPQCPQPGHASERPGWQHGAQRGHGQQCPAGWHLRWLAQQQRPCHRAAEHMGPGAGEQWCPEDPLPGVVVQVPATCKGIGARVHAVGQRTAPGFHHRDSQVYSDAMRHSY
ncbi:UNVERIFIED_CONTAM: hypothetical protein K2H54_074471 [Gekko kuhli]